MFPKIRTKHAADQAVGHSGVTVKAISTGEGSKLGVPPTERVRVSRTIVIGDIHGCFEELVALLDIVDLQKADRVVAVGDLTVKGNKSKEVLDLFIEDSRFSSVLGNHDLSLVRFWRGETSSLKNSQRQTLDELKPNTSRYCEYLGSLPLLIDLGSHVVVHAGVRPEIPLAEQSPEDLTELRTLGPDRTSRAGMPWYEVYDGEQMVLFGHWPNSTNGETSKKSFPF
jgi:serine/threonine protein phosphatase 1